MSLVADEPRTNDPGVNDFGTNDRSTNDRSTNDRSTNDRSTVNPGGEPRVIALEAVHNFRDLGGYATVDGRRVRARRLFRSDGLDRLTVADLATLEALGLHTVIDLRTEAEIARRGRFPVEQHPIEWYHLSLVDVTWDRADVIPESASGNGEEEYLYRQYTDMLRSGEPRLLEAFLVLGLPGAFPAVFHCAAGKDRTGILAALLLGALGVDDATIADDYALTAPAMDRFRAWAEHGDSELAQAVRTMPRHFAAVEPGAVTRLLADVRAEHGSVREYVRSLGVPAETMARIEQALLQPAERRAGRASSRQSVEPA